MQRIDMRSLNAFGIQNKPASLGLKTHFLDLNCSVLSPSKCSFPSSPSILILTTSFTLPIPAALNGRCTGSKATGEWKSDGICIKTSTCRKYKGTAKDGACPHDPDDVKCCVTDECSGHPDGLLYHSRCEWTGDSICNDLGNWLDSEYFPRLC